MCTSACLCVLCMCLTSSVVPQDGDTPPLLHVGQLTARPKHCARSDESTEKTHAVIIKQQQPPALPAQNTNLKHLKFI